MTSKEILSKQISWCKDISSPVSSPITVYESFRAFTEKYASQLGEAREVYEREGHDSERYKQIKRSLPCFVYGGVCTTGDNPSDKGIEPSHLMTIDIDQHDNEGVDIDNYRGDLLKMKGVVGVYHSLSGKGVWILLYIKHPEKFSAHYRYFAKLLKFKFGLVVDPVCKNLSRKRVLGYNPDWITFTNWKDIEEFDLLEEEEEETEEVNIRINTTPSWKKTLFDVRDETERIHKAITEAIDRGYYAEHDGHWYYAACDCKAFSDGYYLFQKLSSNHPKYRDPEQAIRKKFDKAIASPIDDNLARKWFGILKKMK